MSTNPDTAPAPEGPRKRGRPRVHPIQEGRGTVPLSSPVEQEAMAQWVEQFYSKYNQLLVKEAGWLAQHPDDKESRGRLAWYRNALAAAKQLAYAIRTHKLRPLG